MPYLSEITIMGYAGKDAVFDAERDMLKFSVAVNKWKKDSGTMWFNIAVFGRDAKFWQDKVHKGDMVTIIGRFEQREWTDSDGIKRGSLEVVANRIAVMFDKTQQTEPKPAPNSTGTDDAVEIDLDDDDPFKET